MAATVISSNFETTLADDAISQLLLKQGFVMLDGGLGTDLETLGYDISSLSCLWGAYFLNKNPDVIAKVHRRFFEAGADIAITSSYQASFDGFKAEGIFHFLLFITYLLLPPYRTLCKNIYYTIKWEAIPKLVYLFYFSFLMIDWFFFIQQGISEERGIELLKLSVKVAVDTRDEWWENYCNNLVLKKEDSINNSYHQNFKRYKPLVAGSIGPYGASLPGAQEYIGNYKSPSCESCNHNHNNSGEDDDGAEPVYMTVEQLHDWHLFRMEVIGKCEGVDVLAIETIPSFPEVTNIRRTTSLNIYMY